MWVNSYSVLFCPHKTGSWENQIFQEEQFPNELIELWHASGAGVAIAPYPNLPLSSATTSKPVPQMSNNEERWVNRGKPKDARKRHAQVHGYTQRARLNTAC